MSAEFSCFDIIGPVMVGPSSSHTAGACRLGRLARALADNTPVKVDIILHGSFAQTYKGHGTDLALIGGLLGMDTDDERIKDAEYYAKEAGLEYIIRTDDLGEDRHANTVKFIIINSYGDAFTMMGASLGGGKVMITEINDFPVEIDGNLPALCNIHKDQPGAVYAISEVLLKYKINIASMRVYRREEKYTVAFMIIETDDLVPQEAMAEIEELSVIVDVKFIPPIV